MLKKYIIYILLIVLGICIFLFIPEKRSTIENDNIFAVTDTSIINKIFIADRRGNKVLLEKQNNQWIVNNKFNVRKDAIEILISTIGKIRIQRPVPLDHIDKVIRDLATTGVKIEIYNNSNLLKTYTIGSETANHLGTYMLLAGQESPYIMHIPYFNGYLTPRYGIEGQLSNESNWRERLVFNLSRNNINNISVTHLEYPENSFSLKLNPTLLFDYNGKQIEFNDQSISHLLNGFERINCEAFRDEKSIIDSAIVLHELIINNDTLLTYKIRDEKERTKEKNFNVERMYATLNNGELMLIQNYVFNKVLISIDELKK